MIRSIFILFALLWLITTSCDNRSKYQKWLDQELATGERHDSLFYGIYLGMNTKDFFQLCYQKNQDSIFFQGDAAVKYYMKDELPLPATMNFYPEFQDKKIIEMPVRITYDAWAPWNKRTFADSLQIDIKNLFEKWYGSGFVRTSHPKHGVAFVKIDGNRRIIIVKEDDRTAKALFTDMSVKKKEEVPLEPLSNKDKATNSK